MSNWLLHIFKDWHSTSFLCNSFQCLSTLKVSKSGVFFPSSTWNILCFNLCPLPLVLPHRKIWSSLIIIVCLKGKVNLWVTHVVVPKYRVDLYGSSYFGSVEVLVDRDEFIDKSVMRSMLFLFWPRKNPKKLLRRKCVTADLNFEQKWDRIIQFRSQGFITLFVPWGVLFLVFCHVMWMCILLPP